jgi:hypothetical protein
MTQFLAQAPGPSGRAAADQFHFPLSDELREKDHFSPEKYIRAMSLDIVTFAKHARVHRNTVSRVPGASSVQGHIRDSLRVLRAAWDASGHDMDKAKFWFKNEPLPEFGYKTAETLVAEGRADDVIRVIESYEAGATG